jgi:1-phosphofructokinase family hexose kinase
VGGKGENVARMVVRLGGEALLLGFFGGVTGRKVESVLQQVGIDLQPVWVKGETRICQTLVDQLSGESTELVEEMPAIDSNDWKNMAEKFQGLELLESVVAMAGKLPAGAPLDGYAQLARGVKRVILDSWGEPLLCALAEKPFLVKMNEDELQKTVENGNVLDGCNDLLKLGAQSVLITRGGASAYFLNEFQCLELFPPQIEVVNAVGSGDAVTAGLAFGLASGEDMEMALMRGMACGAANAEEVASGWFEPRRANEFLNQVRVERVR